MARKLTDEELKKRLSTEQYQVTQEKGTEMPFSGKYVNHDKDGMYKCVVCGATLFKSDDKFESKTPGLAGWPSFANVANTKAVKLTEDISDGMRRIEVSCANCGSHLGHVFYDADDAPKNGVHFCINSASLDFQPEAKKGKNNDAGDRTNG